MENYQETKNKLIKIINDEFENVEEKESNIPFLLEILNKYKGFSKGINKIDYEAQHIIDYKKEIIKSVMGVKDSIDDILKELILDSEKNIQESETFQLKLNDLQTELINKYFEVATLQSILRKERELYEIFSEVDTLEYCEKLCNKIKAKKTAEVYELLDSSIKEETIQKEIISILKSLSPNSKENISEVEIRVSKENTFFAYLVVNEIKDGCQSSIVIGTINPSSLRINRGICRDRENYCEAIGNIAEQEGYFEYDIASISPYQYNKIKDFLQNLIEILRRINQNIQQYADENH